MADSAHTSSDRASAFASAITAGLVGLGILTPVVLATLGYFGLQFGIMTSCTNDYNCTETLCSPCVPAFTWLTVGAGIQVLLIAALVIVAVRHWRRRRLGLVAALAAVVVVTSVATVIATTWAADRSYCQPGDPEGIYCGI